MRVLLGMAPCACVVAGVGAGHLTGRPWLAAFGRGLQPMSLPALGILAVLAAGLPLAEAGRRSPLARAGAFLAAAVPAILALAASFTFNLPVAGFLGAGASLAFLAASSGQWRSLRQGAAFAALVPFLAGFLLLFGYAAGVPLGYESEALPASLPTALGLFSLGAALLAQAGEACFPLSLFRLDKAERNPDVPWSPRLPLAAFLLLSACIALGGALAMRAQAASTLAAARSQLGAFANLKAGGLDRWVAERRADAELVRRSPLLQGPLAAFLRGNRRQQGELAVWLESLRGLGGYRSATLCDREGRVLLQSGPPEGPLQDPAHRVAFQAALASGAVTLADFHEDAPGGETHAGSWVPVPGSDGKVLGALNLAIGAEPFLGPFLAEGTGPSRLACRLLQGSSREPGTLGAPLALRDEGALRDAETTGLPVDLEEGAGRPLARTYVSLRPVRGTPWILGVQAREADLAVQLRPRFWVVAFATLAIMGGMALATGVLVRRYAARRFREQLAAERERKVLAERAGALMQEANDIILITDTQGRILEANRLAEAAYGYTQEELRAMPAGDLRCPGMEADFLERWSLLMARGRGLWESRHRRRDGSSFPVEASSRVVAQGGETWVVSFIRDISERKAQARAIRRLTGLYAALGQVGQAVVWARDREALFQRICDVLVEHGGMSTAWVARVAGDGSLETAARRGPGDPGAMLPSLGAASALDGPRVLEGRRAAFPVVQDGSVTHLLGVEAADETPFGEEEAELMAETALDLAFALDKLDGEAGRLRAEEEQRRLEAQLQQAQKMESLGSLAGGVAHDLNNVLGAILSLASAQQEAGELPPGLSRSLDTIVKACLRGRDVIKSLLYFSRKGLDSTKPLDLNALLRELTQLLAHTTLKRVQLDLELEEGLPRVLGDASALSHAVMNLCVNAVDAMPGGGTLTLATRREPGGGVALEVRDTGEGMPPEVLAKAMEPFFTTKPLGKGTGLGLSMVFGTMKAHDGVLDLESRPGAGTRAILRFPGERVGAGEELAAPALPRPRADAARHVLLVDDDELVREAVAHLLRSLGHHVDAVPGGREAMDLLKGGLAPDLVVLDMNMPGLTGPQVLPMLLEARPGLQVILASGHSHEDGPALAASHPGVTFLRKPFSLGEIREALAGA